MGAVAGDMKASAGIVDLSRASSVGAGGVDGETRLMMINMGMLDNIDKRMSSQMDTLQRRNEQAAALRTLYSEATAISAKIPPNSAPDYLYPKPGDAADYDVWRLADDLAAAQIDGYETFGYSGQMTKSGLDGLITKLNGMMDSATQIQQLEMFGLQSTVSKRNEIYELMSNVFKKCQDTKSTLIRNF
jgi:hypothetical protein